MTMTTTTTTTRRHGGSAPASPLHVAELEAVPPRREVRPTTTTAPPRVEGRRGLGAGEEMVANPWPYHGPAGEEEHGLGATVCPRVRDSPTAAAVSGLTTDTTTEAPGAGDEETVAAAADAAPADEAGTQETATAHDASPPPPRPPPPVPDRVPLPRTAAPIWARKPVPETATVCAAAALGRDDDEGQAKSAPWSGRGAHSPSSTSAPATPPRPSMSAHGGSVPSPAYSLFPGPPRPAPAGPVPAATAYPGLGDTPRQGLAPPGAPAWAHAPAYSPLPAASSDPRRFVPLPAGFGPGACSAPPCQPPYQPPCQPPYQPYVAPLPGGRRRALSSGIFSSSSARKWLDKTSQMLESKLDEVLLGPRGAAPHGAGPYGPYRGPNDALYRGPNHMAYRGPHGPAYGPGPPPHMAGGIHGDHTGGRNYRYA